MICKEQCCQIGQRFQIFWGTLGNTLCTHIKHRRITTGTELERGSESIMSVVMAISQEFKPIKPSRDDHSSRLVWIKTICLNAVNPDTWFRRHVDMGAYRPVMGMGVCCLEPGKFLRRASSRPAPCPAISAQLNQSVNQSTGG